MSQKGIRTLSLFDDMVSVPVFRIGTGRDPRLHELRNECLIHRYLFIYHACRWEYPLLVAALAKEFFLSKDTVMEIIKDNSSCIKEIRKELAAKGFDHSVFINKYPHINWAVPQMVHYCEQ